MTGWICFVGLLVSSACGPHSADRRQPRPDDDQRTRSSPTTRRPTPQQRITLRCEPAGGEVQWNGAWRSLDGGFTFSTGFGPIAMKVRHKTTASVRLTITTDPPNAPLYNAANTRHPLARTPARIVLDGPWPVTLALDRPGY